MKSTHTASCHCGSVRLALNFPNGLVDVRRCNCSMCSRRGAIVCSAELDQLKVAEGADKLSLYTFNTHTAKHYFCSICGIYTHHQRRSNPNQYGVNVACIDGVDPFSFTDVPVGDGRNHSCDR